MTPLAFCLAVTTAKLEHRRLGTDETDLECYVQFRD